jgi:peptidoglycan/LPS O-acetylase OafA/YrhL
MIEFTIIKHFFTKGVIKLNTLNEMMMGRKNNFDLIRFLAATIVIFSHSFPLSYGNNTSEPLLWLSKGQSTLGETAVYIFFITSGFLITQSFDRSSNIITYAKARVLRIFPALIVAIFITTFVFGALVTNLPIKEYFTNKLTYTYLTNILLKPINSNLPGVFVDNIFKNTVNGSLWTLLYEFAFYILVGLLGITKLLNKKIVVCMLPLSLIMMYLTTSIGGIIHQTFILFIYFGMGMAIYLFRNSIQLNFKFAVYCFLALIITIFTTGFAVAFAFFGAYLTMYFAFHRRINYHNFSKYGDFSYGLYIYAFPIQQIVTNIFHGSMNNYFNFIISFPATLIFAFLSWHFIEKNALKLRRKKLFFENKNSIKQAS